MRSSKWIADILQGTLYGDPTAVYEGCNIDSRKLVKGELFIALKGEQTDGHHYIPNAFRAGASIVLAETAKLEASGVSDRLDAILSDCPGGPGGRALIAVENSFEALQTLAKETLGGIRPIVIGVTGSCGKTTTKDMIAAVLEQKYRVHKNKENYNNELGLPLTILSSPLDCEIMVLEMGMRGLGQIKALCELGGPSAGVITNIGMTHMELLGSHENIARAKWELIDCLPESGTAILNADDYYSVEKSAGIKPKALFYGIEGKYRQPDIIAKNIRPNGPLATWFTVKIAESSFYSPNRAQSPQNAQNAQNAHSPHSSQSSQNIAEVNLGLPGNHNVLDALAALATGYVYGVSLAEGAKALENLQMSKMRLEILKGMGGSTIISDVYNANPTSMQASLQILAERGGEKTIAVLGEMYELGYEALSGHREVGETAAGLNITEIIAVGPLAQNIALGALDKGMEHDRVHICGDCAEAVSKTRELIMEMGSDVWLLIKGSRGMKMERISSALLEE